MSQPYIGEIRMVAFNYAPYGWAFCNGQLLLISQNQALFALLGTMYGGNGTTNFALPNLQGRVPIHMGQGAGLSSHPIGEPGGLEIVTLTQNQMPAHSHGVNAVEAGGNQAGPGGNLPAIESTGTSLDYSSNAPDATMNSAMIGSSGGGKPVSIMQPYLVVNFVIALIGIFPSRN